MTLPPIGQIGDAHQDAVLYIAMLAREARDARADLIQTVEDNINVFRFGKTTGSPADGELVVNEIQNAIIAATHIQTQEPPSASLEPVETGEQPLYYWAGPQDIGIGVFGLQAFEVADWLDENGQLQPPTPLDPLIAGQLKALTVPEEVSPALQPGTIRPEWLIEVSDQTIAEDYQTILDLFWSRSNCDQFIRDLLLRTNIQGWTFALYEFDDTRLRHNLKILPILHVYIDPTVRSIEDAAYAGFDLPMWADEAKALYPDLAEDIDAEASTGRPAFIDQNSEYSSTYDRDFQRPMVTFRVFWLRNQPVPLTKEEAVALGEIVEQPNEVPQFVDGTLAGDDTAAGGATSAGDEGADDAEQVQPLPAPTDAGVAADQGGPAGGGLAPTDASDAGVAPPASTTCVSATTGQPCYPGDPDWPTRIGVRQLVQVGPRIVDDRECEHWDIPLLHSVNIPFPTECPWGQGEPERLKGQQAALMRVINAMVTHGDYHAAPLTTMSQSMYDSLPPQFRDGRIKPGMVIVVPDDQYMALGGKIETVHEPSPLSPAHVDLVPMLKQFLDDNSGHSDALQGKSMAGDSGKKVELLQSAGTGVAGFKAKRTEGTVQRLTYLMLHSIVHRLEIADLAKILTKPPHILEVIQQRARDIEWNVKVVVQSGSGLQIQKKQMALEDLAAGLISRQTAQEESGRDPRLEEQRINLELAKMAQTGMVQSGQEQQPGGGPPEKKEKGPPQ